MPLNKPSVFAIGLHGQLPHTPRALLLFDAEYHQPEDASFKFGFRLINSVLVSPSRIATTRSTLLASDKIMRYDDDRNANLLIKPAENIHNHIRRPRID